MKCYTVMRITFSNITSWHRKMLLISENRSVVWKSRDTKLYVHYVSLLNKYIELYLEPTLWPYFLGTQIYGSDLSSKVQRSSRPHFEESVVFPNKCFSYGLGFITSAVTTSYACEVLFSLQKDPGTLSLWILQTVLWAWPLSIIVIL